MICGTSTAEKASPNEQIKRARTFTVALMRVRAVFVSFSEAVRKSRLNDQSPSRKQLLLGPTITANSAGVHGRLFLGRTYLIIWLIDQEQDLGCHRIQPPPCVHIFFGRPITCQHTKVHCPLVIPVTGDIRAKKPMLDKVRDAAHCRFVHFMRVAFNDGPA
jgi:hypothetical protein